MHLVASGKPVAVVPVEYQGVKMTLYKGEDALAARREVASKLTHRMLTALQRKRNVNDVCEVCHVYSWVCALRKERSPALAPGP